MAYPITIVSGPAGSGKDTVAELVAKHFGGITVAQADPMKKMLLDWMGDILTEEMLWGPSELRNSYLKLSEFQKSILLANLDPLVDALEFVLKVTNHSVPREELESTVRPWARSALRPVEGQVSPRTLLQTLGTEVGRSLHKDMWIDYAIWTAEKLLVGGSDCFRDKGLVVDKHCRGYNQVLITDGRFRNEILAVRKLGGLAVRVLPAHDPQKNVGIAGHASEVEMRTIPNGWFTHILQNNKDLGLRALEGNIANNWPHNTPEFIE